MRQQCMYDAATEMDLQLVQLEKARAILSKVNETFERKIEPGTSDAFSLIADTERLHLLLTTADELISRVIPELKIISNDVYESYKLHKRGWEEMRIIALQHLGQSN